MHGGRALSFSLAEIQKRKFRAVLFDLDGTLVEFKFNLKDSRVAIIKWLSINGYDISNISSETKTQKIFDIIRLQCESEKGTHKNYGAARQSMSDILEDFEFKAFSETKPHSGSLTLLKTLKEEQYLTAIVTNSGHKPVFSILGEFGFAPFVSTIITRDEMVKLKPEPDGIIKALELLNVTREESMFVGDSVIDIQAAHKAGVTSVALSQGMSSAHVLAREEPDYLISTIEEVGDIIHS